MRMILFASHALDRRMAIHWLDWVQVMALFKGGAKRGRL